MEMTYVSIPYSDADPAVRRRRMVTFWKACAYLTRQGKAVLSPMTLEPMVLADPTLSTDWDDWKTYAAFLMALCSEMVIVTADGWNESSGVQGEIAMADQIGLKIVKLDPALVESIGRVQA